MIVNNNNKKKKKKKENLPNNGLSRSSWEKLKESEKKDKLLDRARKLEKKNYGHESEGDTNCNSGTRYSHQRINKGGAHDAMVIVVGNGDGDMSSNPGRDWLHFT